jgi:hypothetical protein
MTENKSQDPYGETTTSLTFNGNPVPPGTFTTPITPQTLFSNTPAQKTPGTFAQGSHPINPIIYTTGPKVGKEISNKETDPALQQKREDRLRELVSLSQEVGVLKSRIDGLEKNYPIFDFKLPMDTWNEINHKLNEQLTNPDTTETSSIFDDLVKKDTTELKQIVEDYEQLMKRGEGLLKLALKYDAANSQGNTLLANSSTDKDFKKNLRQSLDELAWLKEVDADQEKDEGIPLEEIEKRLDEIVTLITNEEKRLIKQEAENQSLANEEALKNETEKTGKRLRELGDLAISIGEVMAKLKALLSKKLTDEDKKLLTDRLDLLSKKHKKAQDDLSENSLTELKDFILECETHVHEAEEAFTKIEALTVDVWSGWPENRFHKKKADPKNGTIPTWVYFTDGGTPISLSKVESDAWEKERENFDRVFDDYKKFFVDDQSKKILEFKSLIDSKNDVIKAVNSNDVSRAGVLREILRQSLEKAKKDWNEKIEKKKALEPFLAREKKAKAFFDTQKSIIERFKIAPSFQKLKVSFDNRVSQLQDWQEQFKTTLEGNPFDTDTATAQITDIENALKVLQEEVDAVVGKLADKDRIVLRSPFAHTQSRSTESEVKEVVLRKAKKFTSGVTLKKVNYVKDVTSTENANGAVTEEEWKALTSIGIPQTETPDITNSREESERARKFEEMKTLHTEMFLRNPRAYERLYVGKKWLPGDELTQEVVEGILRKRLAKIKEDRLEFEVEKNTREQRLGSDNVSEADKDRLTREIVDFTRKIEIIDIEITFLEGSGVPLPRGRTTLEDFKEAYSPERDASIAYIKRAGTPNTWRERAPIKRALRARAELIKSSGISTMSVEELRASGRKPNGDIPPHKDGDPRLSDRATPAHYDGMVRSLDKDDVKDGEYVTTKYETPPEWIPRQPSTTYSPGESRESSQENTERRQGRVKGLIKTFAEILDRNHMKTAIAVLAITAGGYALHQKIDTEKSRATSIAEMIANTSWRDTIQSPEDRAFLDLLKNSPTFESFSAQRLSSIASLQNLSTIKALSDMQCAQLLNGEEGIYGLNAGQRRNVCEIVQALEKVIQYTEIKERRADSFGRPFKQNPYSFSDGQMTIKELYENTLKAIQSADRKVEEARKAIAKK